MLKYRLPASKAVGDFGRNNANGSVFYDQSKFNFVANNVSYRTLVNEMTQSMGYSPEMIESQLQMFRASVNRDPDSFRVPEDNGDPFFKKLNLGLLLINKSGSTYGVISRIRTVIDWMAERLRGSNAAIVDINATKNLLTPQGTSPNSIYETLVKIGQLYNSNGGARPTDPQLVAIGSIAAIYGATLGQVRPDGGAWRGNQMDLLHVLVANVFAGQAFGRRNENLMTSAFFKNTAYNNNVITQDASSVLVNISNRLSADSFFRENNFREVLQEVGIPMEEFERLVENATTTIYWPDCIASKSSLQDLIYLVKGLGVYKEGMEQMSKAELCSFILTSFGYKAENFTGDFNWNTILDTESRTNLERIIAAVRREGLTNRPNGYLGRIRDGGNPHPLNGAYLLTAYAAHNVTMDKAVQWLKAAGVDSATQISFINYAKNENVFDLVGKRTEATKPVNMHMDYTRAMLEQNYDQQYQDIII